MRWDVAFFAYCAVCLAALVWPGALLARGPGPQVLGLPPSLAWNVGWVLLTFAVLAAYHAKRG
jgi:hypothetical protein